MGQDPQVPAARGGGEYRPRGRTRRDGARRRLAAQPERWSLLQQQQQRRLHAGAASVASGAGNVDSAARTQVGGTEPNSSADASKVQGDPFLYRPLFVKVDLPR